MIITADSTDVSLPAYFVDDDGGTAPGEPTTGLLFSDIETGGSASYQRQGAARVDLTLITLASASAAHADGGFILIDDTNMPGLYRVDYPDAAFATGVDFVTIQMVAASDKNTVVRPLLIDLTDIDLRDSVRGGMTALPNAAAEAAGGIYTRGTGAGQIKQDANGRVDGNVAAINANANAAIRLALSAAQIIPGTVDTASFTPTVTSMEADDITEATADHFNGRILIGTSGVLLGQATNITDYSLEGSNGRFTFAAMTEAFGNNDTFIIV